MTTPTYPTSELDRTTIGFGLAASITVVFSMLLTIVKESYPPLLALMKSIPIFGVKHHWLVHGLTVVALFYLLGWLFSKSDRLSGMRGDKLAAILAWATVLSSLAIFGFYLLEVLE